MANTSNATSFSVIDIPLNPRNTSRKAGEYKILSFSDLHFGFPQNLGDIMAPFNYTFFSGCRLYIDPGDPPKANLSPKSYSYLSQFGTAYKPREILFHAGTEVVYHNASTVSINGNEVAYSAGEKAVYEKDTAVCFSLPTLISIPDGTTVTFQWLNSYMRGLLLVDMLLREESITHYDAIVMPGDIVSNECGYYFASNDMKDHFWYRLKTYYFNKLDEAGIPWFLAYGNHDDMDDEEWATLFPSYTKNFCLRIGDNLAAVLGFDTNATPNTDTESRNRVFYGFDSDIDHKAVEAFSPIMEECQDALAYMHYFTLAKKTLLDMKATHDNLRAVVVGHSHFSRVHALSSELSAYEIGNFGWNGSINAAGLAGRNPDGSAILANQLRANAANAPSGVWNFAYVESRITDEGRRLLYYMVFPELHYSRLFGCGIEVPDFYQERYSTEGETTGDRYSILYPS